MSSLAFLSSTGGTNLQSFIDAKARGDFEPRIACLITNKLDCGAAEKAKAVGIPVYFVDPSGKSREQYDREVMEVLEHCAPDLVVLGGYMRIIGPEMVRAYPRKIVNVHPSLLPKHAGLMAMQAHQAVLDAGESETGMTIHFVDEGVDTGEVVLQKSVPVNVGDTADILKDKVQALEKEWYPKVVQHLLEA
ncbi:phosphoribosylglycinamide formyltransferase [Candidatus Peregrinibacteria bacterium]|nr:MAG: phosphoribosylglycinamide formyltransferase [Candidatus Peregrinibacteria bacterium]